MWPTLSRQFGEAVARDAWLYDAFLLKFDGHPGRRGLGLHVDDDGLGVSINLLLSSTDDFEGGGTLFTPVCDGAGAGRRSVRAGRRMQAQGQAWAGGARWLAATG